ncbi:translation elongation factor P [Alicyclobacillus hesperidum URH17-3-68]|nr:translation elongation factor P [Alicyclobacillus hesperidum URH17-3-68]
MAAGFDAKVAGMDLNTSITARLIDASPILAGLRSKSVEYDLSQFTLFAFGETV